MKKLIFFSALAAILAASCGLLSYKYTSVVHNHYIINLTEKEIIHEVEYYSQSVHYNDRLRYISDGTTNQEEFEWLITQMKNQYEHEVIHYRYSRLYSIDDTTSLSWKFDRVIFPNDYYYYVDYEQITDSGIVCVSDYYLIVNDSIISTMQKDYSMLEKFSEYYGN